MPDIVALSVRHEWSEESQKGSSIVLCSLGKPNAQYENELDITFRCPGIAILFRKPGCWGCKQLYQSLLLEKADVLFFLLRLLDSACQSLTK